MWCHHIFFYTKKACLQPYFQNLLNVYNMHTWASLQTCSHTVDIIKYKRKRNILKAKGFTQQLNGPWIYVIILYRAICQKTEIGYDLQNHCFHPYTLQKLSRFKFHLKFLSSFYCSSYKHTRARGCLILL